MTVADLQNLMQITASGFLFLVALAFCYRQFNPAYLQSFPVFAGLNLAFNTTIALVSEASWDRILEQSYSIFDLLYFTYFISGLIKSPKTKSSFWLAAVCCTILLAVTAVFKNETLFATCLIFESLVLVLGCISYIRETFRTREIDRLEREPAFWIVSGILAYSIFEILLAGILLYVPIKSHLLGALVFTVNGSSQIVAIFLYMIGLSCRSKKIL